MNPLKSTACQKQPSLYCQLVLDNLLAQMPSHIYWKNLHGVYLGCNDLQAKSLGLNHRQEVIGKTDFELPWDQQSAKRFWDNDKEVLTTGRSKTVEEWAMVDGQPAVMLSLKAPLKKKDGEVIGILGISIDITRQKQVEEKLIQAKEAAEAANIVKIEFLENMRHDIRTPLMGIMGCAQAIKDNLNDAKKRADYADHLMSSSQALANLLNEVLESIKVSNGTLPLLKKRFNLLAQLKSMIALNQARATQKQLALTLEYDDRIPNYLIGDPTRIQRVVLELINNALNFTHQGYVTVKARLAKQYDHTLVLKIDVKDSGMGIAKNKQQEVFTRFKRMTPSYEGIYQGAGLGLSIIKQFVDDMEGELYFESRPEQGSVFTCVLPLKKALLDEDLANDDPSMVGQVEQAAQRQPDPSTSASPGLKILVVEDNSIAAKVVQSLLESLNCTVEVAADAKTALQLASSQKYDLIFLDIGLPDKSGIEVAKEIRQWDRHTNQQVPIVALTAHADHTKKDDCLQAGMNAVLSKPLSKNQALQVLNQFFKTSNSL